MTEAQTSQTPQYKENQNTINHKISVILTTSRTNADIAAAVSQNSQYLAVLHQGPTHQDYAAAKHWIDTLFQSLQPQKSASEKSSFSSSPEAAKTQEKTMESLEKLMDKYWEDWSQLNKSTGSIDAHYTRLLIDIRGRDLSTIDKKEISRASNAILKSFHPNVWTHVGIEKPENADIKRRLNIILAKVNEVRALLLDASSKETYDQDLRVKLRAADATRPSRGTQTQDHQSYSRQQSTSPPRSDSRTSDYQPFDFDDFLKKNERDRDNFAKETNRFNRLQYLITNLSILSTSINSSLINRFGARTIDTDTFVKINKFALDIQATIDKLFDANSAEASLTLVDQRHSHILDTLEQVIHEARITGVSVEIRNKMTIVVTVKI